MQQDKLKLCGLVLQMTAYPNGFLPLDKPCVYGLWPECSRWVHTIAKRRLVAKNRIAASFEMGGLQIQSSMDIAQGLLLNTFQRLRLQAMLADEDQMFYSNLGWKN